MKRFINAISIFLILAMILSILPVSAIKTVNAAEASTAEPGTLNGADIGNYVIVYSDDEPDYNYRAAEYIQEAIKAKTGDTVSIVEDNTAESTYEILVGDTNRSLSKSLTTSGEAEMKFVLQASGTKIAMEGDYFIIAGAAYYFAENYLPTTTTGTTVPNQKQELTPIVEKANKYVMMVGDGMGVQQTKLFEEYSVPSSGIHAFSDGEDVFYGYYFPYQGFSQTTNIQSAMTDSAAGGTALSTGYKTENGRVGQDKDGNDVKNLAELALELGWGAAVMSTEGVGGATPASFSIHTNNRNDEENIKTLQAELAAKGVLLFDDYTTYDAYTAEEWEECEPRLRAALDTMFAQDNFFMMYEEAYIDIFCHQNIQENAFRGVYRFNQAIGAVMEYAMYNPDTFVLITADHETGNMTEEFEFTTTSHSIQDVPVFAYGVGGNVFDGMTYQNASIGRTFAHMMTDGNADDFGDSQWGILTEESIAVPDSPTGPIKQGTVYEIVSPKKITTEFGVYTDTINYTGFVDGGDGYCVTDGWYQRSGYSTKTTADGKIALIMTLDEEIDFGGLEIVGDKNAGHDMLAFDIQAYVDGQWVTVKSAVSNPFKFVVRTVKYTFDAVKTKQVRILVNDSESSEVYLGEVSLFEAKTGNLSTKINLNGRVTSNDPVYEGTGDYLVDGDKSNLYQNNHTPTQINIDLTKNGQPTAIDHFALYPARGNTAYPTTFTIAIQQNEAGVWKTLGTYNTGWGNETGLEVCTGVFDQTYMAYAMTITITAGDEEGRLYYLPEFELYQYQREVDPDAPVDPTEPATVPTVATEASGTPGTLNGADIGEYVIVYSEDEPDYNYRAAEYIRDAIEEKTGDTLRIVEDDTAEAACEILVGDTNRSLSQSLEAPANNEMKFAIQANGTKIALEGDYFIVAGAAYYFTQYYLPSDTSGTTVPSTRQELVPITEKANNYIMLIGDGMGVRQTKLFDYYDVPTTGNYAYSDGEDIFYGYYFPNQGFSDTHNIEGAITDSAAGGTALSSGYRTENQRIGQDKEGNSVKTLVELALERGMAAGVMSTEGNAGATPSSFSAHTDSRYNEDEIKADQAELAEQGVLFIDEYNKYASFDKVEWNSYEPQVRDALDTLAQDPDGFFVMYEEAHIDKNCHSNYLEDTFITVYRFNQAIGAFMEFAMYNPDTVVLITADHETGDLRDDFTYRSTGHSGQDVPVFAYGEGTDVFDGLTYFNATIARTIAHLMTDGNADDFGDPQYAILTEESIKIPEAPTGPLKQGTVHEYIAPGKLTTQFGVYTDADKTVFVDGGDGACVTDGWYHRSGYSVKTTADGQIALIMTLDEVMNIGGIEIVGDSKSGHDMTGFDIQVYVNGQWQTIKTATANPFDWTIRTVRYTFDAVQTDQVRILVNSSEADQVYLGEVTLLEETTGVLSTKLNLTDCVTGDSPVHENEENNLIDGDKSNLFQNYHSPTTITINLTKNDQATAVDFFRLYAARGNNYYPASVTMYVQQNRAGAWKEVGTYYTGWGNANGLQVLTGVFDQTYMAYAVKMVINDGGEGKVYYLPEFELYQFQRDAESTEPEDPTVRPTTPPTPTLPPTEPTEPPATRPMVSPAPLVPEDGFTTGDYLEAIPESAITPHVGYYINDDLTTLTDENPEEAALLTNASVSSGSWVRGANEDETGKLPAAVLDLNGTKTIGAVEFVVRPTQYITVFDVEVLDTNGVWQNVVSVTKDPFAETGTVKYTFDPIAASKVRVLIYQFNEDDPMILELVVYEVKNGTIPVKVPVYSVTADQPAADEFQGVEKVIDGDRNDKNNYFQTTKKPVKITFDVTQEDGMPSLINKLKLYAYSPSKYTAANIAVEILTDPAVSWTTVYTGPAYTTGFTDTFILELPQLYFAYSVRLTVNSSLDSSIILPEVELYGYEYTGELEFPSEPIEPTQPTTPATEPTTPITGNFEKLDISGTVLGTCSSPYSSGVSFANQSWYSTQYPDWKNLELFVNGNTSDEITYSVSDDERGDVYLDLTKKNTAGVATDQFKLYYGAGSSSASMPTVTVILELANGSTVEQTFTTNWSGRNAADPLVWNFGQTYTIKGIYAYSSGASRVSFAEIELYQLEDTEQPSQPATQPTTPPETQPTTPAVTEPLPTVDPNAPVAQGNVLAMVSPKKITTQFGYYSDDTGSDDSTFVDCNDGYCVTDGWFGRAGYSECTSADGLIGLVMTLDSTMTLGGINIIGKNAENDAAKFEVQAYVNGQWVTVVNQTTNAFASTRDVMFNFSQQVTTNKVRILVHAVAVSGNQCYFNEVVLYEAKTGEQTQKIELDSSDILGTDEHANHPATNLIGGDKSEVYLGTYITLNLTENGQPTAVDGFNLYHYRGNSRYAGNVTVQVQTTEGGDYVEIGTFATGWSESYPQEIVTANFSQTYMAYGIRVSFDAYSYANGLELFQKVREATDPEEADKILVGASYSVHLIEPWALRTYVQFAKNTQDNLINVSTFTDYGAYAIISNKFDGTTAEQLMADPDAIHYTKAAGDISANDATTLTFDFYDGLYSYNLGESIYWVAYYTDANGTYYTEIKEKSLTDVADALLGDGDVEESEKAVLNSMKEMKDTVTALRGENADLGNVYPAGTANPGTLGERTTGYLFGTSHQIKLIEPWGVRVLVQMRDKAANAAADYESADDYGVIFFHDKTGKYGGTMTAAQLNAEEGAKVYSKLGGNAVINAGGVTAVYDHEIYTYDLDTELYCLPYIVIDGTYYYPSTVTCWNLLAEMTEFSQDTTLDPLETAVFDAMLEMYDNVQTHRG